MRVLFKYLIIIVSLSLFPSHINAGNNVILKKNLHLREQMKSESTWYTITEVFDLNGETISVPENSVLEFRGGSIRGGTIVFNQTKILNPSFIKMHFKGSVREDYFNIDDYGACAGVKVDCSELINELISLNWCNSTRSSKTIHIPNGTYYLTAPINLWAGWEAPITMEGNGNTSTLCQLTDNEPILNVFECHYVKNLRLTYNQRQCSGNSGSVAIACQRAIYCLFENLTICKANTAFGYISLEKQKKGFNPTGVKDQCYVSCNFRNIRIYETSNYALDFKKEFAQCDSGSSFDNIYINSNDWLGNTRDNVSRGALRGDNTVACFTQLNIEGANYTNTLIDLGGMSRVSIESLHMEGLKNIPSFSRVRVQSVVSINMIDVQDCEFENNKNSVFAINDGGLTNVKILTVRQDCKQKGGQVSLSNKSDHLIIEQKLDAIKVFK